MPTVSVVIPCRNEARNLPFVIENLPEFVTELVVVDADSTDGSVETVLRCRPDAIVIGQHSPGKGAASLAGLMRATGDVVILIDADGSMEVTDMKEMVVALEDGHDIVHASRGLAGAGSDDFTAHRKLGNDLLTWGTNQLYGTDWTDLTFGYLALWRDVVDGLNLATLIEGAPREPIRILERTSKRPRGYGHGFEVEVLMLCRAAAKGYVIGEIPSHEHKRRHGTSNLNAARDGLRVAGTIARERVGRKVRPDPKMLEIRMRNRPTTDAS